MTITMEVNGRRVDANKGETLLEALQREGLRIPTLCHSPLLSPTGTCRICVVEMKVSHDAEYRMITSCDTQCEDGMQIRTDTEALRLARRGVLSLVLRLPPSSCILCGRCVRVCCDVVGACAISLVGRGAASRVAAPFDEDTSVNCIACGACASVCPTGHAAKFPSERLKSMASETTSPRPCRYALMNLLPGAVCSNNYQCATCEVHQCFQNGEGGAHPVFVWKRRLHE